MSKELEKQVVDILCIEIEGGRYGINVPRFEKIERAARAIIAKLSQTKPSPSLRWVKASERLPGDDLKDIVCRNKANGTVYSMPDSRGTWTEWHKENVEWLEDPSESPSPDISISEDENKYTLKDLKESWEAAEIWALNGPYSKNYKGETIRQNPDFQTYFKSKQK